MPLLSTKQPVQKTLGPFVLTRDSQTKTQPILRKMETYNIRPRNLKTCVRISNPLPLASLSVTGSSYKMFRFDNSLHRLRGKQPPFSESNKNNPILDREFLQSPVFSPKKGRNLSPSNRPESSQQVCGKLSFPNGKHFMSQNSLKEGGLHDMCDLKDAYLSVQIHESSQKYLCFQWRNRSFAFQGLPFGLNTAPRIFTQLLNP